MIKVVVSGANGFLGSHIVRLLTKNGIDVHALVRKGSSTKFISTRCQSVNQVDYQDKKTIKEIFNGADFFINSAALVRDWGEYEDFKKANIELPLKLIDIAIQTNIKNIIHISTNAVLGEENNLKCKDESCPYNPKLNYFMEKNFPSGMNHYKISKTEGEIEIINQAKKNDLNLTVLRPVWIFGPREFNAGPYEYCKIIQDKIPFMPGNKKNKFHTVYVEDVARAVLAVVKKVPIGTNIYNIGSNNVLPMHEFYQKFCTELKKKKPVNIPGWIIHLPVCLLEMIYLIFKIKTPPLLTRARLYMFYANNIYDVKKAKEELGFIADTNIDWAIRKTILWWKLNKYL